MTALATAPAPLLAFSLEVAAVTRLSPCFRRITLAGAALVDFHPGGPLGPRDLRVKLLLPADGGADPELGPLEPGWYPRWRALPPAVRGHLRTYTVRALRLDLPVPQLDLDVVLHEAPETAGPGSTWAAAAEPGDRVTLLGPHARAGGPAGVEWRPPPTRHDRPVRVLLAGDETAVPAVSSVLASLPAGYVGQAVLEVPTAADFVDLRTAGTDVEVCWLARGARAHGAALQQAVRTLLAADPPVPRRLAATGGALTEVDIDTQLLWDTPTGHPATTSAQPRPFYAWMAGEAATVRDLRRLLVTEHGVDRGSVAFMGYWRRGRPELT